MFELALLAVLATAPAPAAVSAADRALLAQSDPFARAPAASRAVMEVRAGSGAPLHLEIWRSGDNALVRFLDPRERGKYLLRAPAGTYFIAPGAKQPMRLPPTHRLANTVALDELLGVGLEKEYAIYGVSRRDATSGIVEFDLAATTASAPYPRLRWVVAERGRLPLRVDFRLADGRVARVLEWKEWRDRSRLAPKTIVIKDVLRGGAPVTVTITEFEARAVDAEIFSLTDPQGRAQFESVHRP